MQRQWLDSQQLLGNEPGQVKVLDEVPRWQVYFFRGNAWSNAQSSADVDPAEPPAPGASAPLRTPRALLPSGVRAVLTLGAAGAAPTLTRDVAITAHQP